jgi:hypothetical protein
VPGFLDAGILAIGRRIAFAHEKLNRLEPLRLGFARVVDVEVVEKPAGDVAAGGP